MLEECTLVAIDYIFASPQNSFVKNLMPKVMVLGGAFGGYLVHECGVLTNRISGLIKEVPERSLTPSAV